MMRRMIGLMMMAAACSAADGASSGITVRDSAGIEIIEHELAALNAVCRVDSVPSVRIGVADGPEEYMFYRLFGATQLSDGRIVIVNQGSQEIRYYAPDGTFLRRAGRAGQGPGEFSDAFYIWQTRGDTVYVGDYDPWQFEVFSPEGEWVRDVRPEPPYVNSPAVIAVLSDGRLVLAEDPFPTSNGLAFELEKLLLVVHDAEGALSDSLFELSNGRYGRLMDTPEAMTIHPLFESYAQVAGSGIRLVTGHGSSPELKLWAGDSLELEAILRWSADDRRIGQAEIDAERTRLSDQYPDLDLASRTRYVDPLIDPDRPVADRFPAFREVQVGMGGRIWVREYRRPTDSGRPRWLGFDESGRFACAATMPVAGEVLEFGDDYILMKDPDEDGVERVSRFTLGSPTKADP